MAATDVTRSSGAAHAGDNGLVRTARRLSTETKAAFKTTEFYAYIAVLAGILVAGLVVDGDGVGADGGFAPSEVWLFATVLTVGYMISRGLAKAGSRQPYDDDGDNDRR
jgi:hypothetical protein